MGAPQNNDLYGMICQIVEEETIFLRHYIGEVVRIEDPLQKGRVKVTIKDLGFDSDSNALWCYPRQGNGMSVPKLNTYVEVYFLNGKPDNAVYLFPAVEMRNMVPSKFDGQQKTHLLFQDPDSESNYMKFDGNTNTLDVKLKTGGKINLLSATSKFVLGDELDTWFNNTLITWLNSHIHTAPVGGNTTGAVTPFTSPPTNYLSSYIKGS